MILQPGAVPFCVMQAQICNARIKALGNAIVPQVAYQIFKAIEQAEVNHV